MTSLSVGASEYLLAFADDEHLIGQQHTEWIGIAPFLEEDLAFCSIAQDELGHAAALYELIGDADQLALHRPASEYRSCTLVEMPCAEWDDAFVRHWLYDLAEQHRWSALADSNVPGLAGLVARCQREEDYHRRHADVLLARLRDTEASDRIDAAIARLLPFADALFEPVGGESEALADGVATTPSAELRARWRDGVEEAIGPVDWPAITVPDQDARRRRHPAFAAMLERITEVIRLDPTARW